MPRTSNDDSRKSEPKREASEKPRLEQRYGSIGIPAVAAAARYHKSSRRPDRPATSARDRQREDA
ncbi:MAG TPA: hypothetical protein VHG27_09170 [Xanthobacteraceae bacterium]|nr:hypothetical protein [Xanthobacteraceae bacterium]